MKVATKIKAVLAGCAFIGMTMFCIWAFSEKTADETDYTAVIHMYEKMARESKSTGWGQKGKRSTVTAYRTEMQWLNTPLQSSTQEAATARTKNKTGEIEDAADGDGKQADLPDGVKALIECPSCLDGLMQLLRDEAPDNMARQSVATSLLMSESNAPRIIEAIAEAVDEGQDEFKEMLTQALGGSDPTEVMEALAEELDEIEAYAEDPHEMPENSPPDVEDDTGDVSGLPEEEVDGTEEYV